MLNYGSFFLVMLSQLLPAHTICTMYILLKHYMIEHTQSIPNNLCSLFAGAKTKIIIKYYPDVEAVA